jgi:hypothetical protein
MLMQLNYWAASWPLRLDCVCDLHFVDYLKEAATVGKMIFHFGTGEHHLVGRNNFAAGAPNEILAITASRGEHDAYIDFIIDNPVAARSYKVLFGDIYTLSPRSLPEFDLVTLFHLCEFYDERTAAYAELDDSSLLELFVGRLRPDGNLFFYKRSSHFSSCRALLQRMTEGGRLVHIGDYKSLLVYGLPRDRVGQPKRGRVSPS